MAISSAKNNEAAKTAESIDWDDSYIVESTEVRPDGSVRVIIKMKGGARMESIMRVVEATTGPDSITKPTITVSDGKDERD